MRQLRLIKDILKKDIELHNFQIYEMNSSPWDPQAMFLLL